MRKAYLLTKNVVYETNTQSVTTSFSLNWRDTDLMVGPSSG